MKWQVAILSLVVFFAAWAIRYPAARWWNLWGMVLVAAGIRLHQYETAREERAKKTGREAKDCWAFYLTLTGSFLVGSGWALYHHLGLWSLLFGSGSALLLLVVFFLGIISESRQEDPAT